MSIPFAQVERQNSHSAESRVFGGNTILATTRDVLSFALVYPDSFPTEPTCVSFWSAQCELCGCCWSAQRVLCESCLAQHDDVPRPHHLLQRRLRHLKIRMSLALLRQTQVFLTVAPTFGRICLLTVERSHLRLRSRAWSGILGCATCAPRAIRPSSAPRICFCD